MPDIKHDKTWSSTASLHVADMLHAHTAHLHECVCIAGDWMAVVMEAIKGDPLSLLVTPVGLDNFVQHLKDALKRCSFVHGDLRPPNIRLGWCLL